MALMEDYTTGILAECPVVQSLGNRNLKEALDLYVNGSQGDSQNSLSQHAIGPADLEIFNELVHSTHKKLAASFKAMLKRMDLDQKSKDKHHELLRSFTEAIAARNLRLRSEAAQASSAGSSTTKTTTAADGPADPDATQLVHKEDEVPEQTPLDPKLLSAT